MLCLKFRSIIDLYSKHEIDFLDFLYDLKIKNCKRDFNNVLFYFLIKIIYVELNSDKDVIFYLNKKILETYPYKGYDHFDPMEFRLCLISNINRIQKLIPHKFLLTEQELPNQCLMSSLDASILDELFLVMSKKFNIKKLLKTLDSKLIQYSKKFDMSNFHF